jgi:hypothetical protein
VENNNGGKYSGFFSKKLRAGKRRTYFFDVRSTKQGDFFLTITESKKKFEGEGYDSHKIFLYKEDFKKFLEALNETVDYIKGELMPDYDYESERPARLANGTQEMEDSFDTEKHDEHEHREGNGSSIGGKQDSTENPNATNPAIKDDEEMTW